MLGLLVLFFRACLSMYGSIQDMSYDMRAKERAKQNGRRVFTDHRGTPRYIDGNGRVAFYTYYEKNRYMELYDRAKRQNPNLKDGDCFMVECATGDTINYTSWEKYYDFKARLNAAKPDDFVRNELADVEYVSDDQEVLPGLRYRSKRTGKDCVEAWLYTYDDTKYTNSQFLGLVYIDPDDYTIVGECYKNDVNLFIKGVSPCKIMQTLNNCIRNGDFKYTTFTSPYTPTIVEGQLTVTKDIKEIKSLLGITESSELEV